MLVGGKVNRISVDVPLPNRLHAKNRNLDKHLVTPYPITTSCLFSDCVGFQSVITISPLSLHLNRAVSNVLKGEKGNRPFPDNVIEITNISKVLHGNRSRALFANVYSIHYATSIKRDQGYFFRIAGFVKVFVIV